MRPNTDVFARYCDNLLEHGRFEIVPFSSLKLDRMCKSVLERAAVTSALKGKPLTVDAADHGAALLDSIQMPMMVYRGSGSEQVTIVCGVFTYHRLIQQQATARTVLSVPVFLLNKPPAPDIRELLLLHELTRNLLRNCFINSSAKIADYLYAWFDCRAEESLFAMEKWQRLFPSIKTKSDLCHWLELSSKTFIPTGHKL